MNTMVDVRLTQTRMSYTSFAMLGAPPAALSVVGPEVSARPGGHIQLTMDASRLATASRSQPRPHLVNSAIIGPFS
jgi:hypothetical protein